MSQPVGPRLVLGVRNALAGRGHHERGLISALTSMRAWVHRIPLRAGTSPPTVGPHAQAVENERRAGTSIASWRQLAWQSVRHETTHAAKSGLSTDTCPVVRFRSDAGSK